VVPRLGLFILIAGQRVLDELHAMATYSTRCSKTAKHKSARKAATHSFLVHSLPAVADFGRMGGFMNTPFCSLEAEAPGARGVC
jgi:hypothetical protein